MRLIRNAAKCRLCGDIVESKHRHDFRSCKCGEIFVDGGLDYSRGGAKTSLENWINLCEYEEAE